MASAETALRPRDTPEDRAAKRQKLIDQLFATEVPRTAMSDEATAQAMGDYIRRVLKKNGHEDLWPVYWDLDAK